MKTASKVFIIISMIWGFWLIVPLIVGIIALVKLNSATCKQDLTAIGVITIIFCSLLGGVFMLCIPEESFVTSKTPNVIQTNQPTTPQPENNTSDLASNLEKLNKLKEQGLINETEYKALRQREIDKSFSNK